MSVFLFVSRFVIIIFYYYYVSFFKPSELFNVSYIKSNLLFQAYDHNYLIRNLDIGCALASSFSPLFFAFFLSSFLKWTIDFILSIKTIHLWGLVPLLISISSRGETSDRCEKRVWFLKNALILNVLSSGKQFRMIKVRLVSAVNILSSKLLIYR